MNVKSTIKNVKLPMFFDFMRWVSIDIYRGIKYGKQYNDVYGIRCISALYGSGKTVSMAWIGDYYRKKMGDDLYIMSNFGFALQDFPYTCVDDLCKHYDKPILILWDEVQNDFPNTERVFSDRVRKELTLCRKGKGKMIYWCSQDHELVHKTIRRLTREYGEARTIAHRYTRVRWYRKDDFIQKYNTDDVQKKMKIKPIKVQKFVQHDDLRQLFKSYEYDNGEQIT